MVQRNLTDLRTAIKTSVLWSTIFCVIVGLLFSLFSATIVSQFTTGNVEMIKIGASSLRINGITFMLFDSIRYIPLYSLLLEKEKRDLFLELADKVSALFLLS